MKILTILTNILAREKGEYIHLWNLSVIVYGGVISRRREKFRLSLSLGRVYEHSRLSPQRC